MFNGCCVTDRYRKNSGTFHRTVHRQTRISCEVQNIFDQVDMSCFKGYHEKHVFSALYIYKLVLPEPINSQNEESKQVLHLLCSPTHWSNGASTGCSDSAPVIA